MIGSWVCIQDHGFVILDESTDWFSIVLRVGGFIEEGRPSLSVDGTNQ